MVDYKYAQLFEEDNVDKRWKIIPVDFIGYKTPKAENNSEQLAFKIYLDCYSWEYYKMLPSESCSYSWQKLDGETGLTVIRNEDLFKGSIEISESLCSEAELHFGACEASSLKFKVANIVKSLKGMWLIVFLVLNHHDERPLPIGRYKVDSDKLTADKMWHEITAYDAMHDILNSSAVSWYNAILPNKNSWVTMYDFRKSFIESFGLRQEVSLLANDRMIIEKTIQVGEDLEEDSETEQVSIVKESSLSGMDVITAICEINGCFGHIGRDGKFRYVYLQQDTMGLYPSEDLYPEKAPEYLPQSETGGLYPQEPDSFEIKRSCCVSCNYEDYIVSGITKVQIRQDENDAGIQYPETESEKENTYIIEDNFLVYGKTSSELSEISKNIFEKIKNIIYRPFNADTRANLCLEVGDAIRISTRFHAVESYILKREMKGGQAIRDMISSQGPEVYSQKLNGIQKSIIQLKGKTNTLIKDAEHTEETIKNLESGAETQRLQTDELIKNTVKKDNLRSEISQSPGVISLKAGDIVISSDDFTLDKDGNMVLRGSISLAWKDDTQRPPEWNPYEFVSTDYNLASEDEGIIYAREPYLVAKSPRGNTAMEIGNRNISNNRYVFKMRDTPYFPNGAVIDGAYIENLVVTEKLKANITNGTEWVNFSYVVSGVFITVYGTYHVYEHDAGTRKTISVGISGEVYIPKRASVRTVSGYGKMTFVFTLTTDGRLVVKNCSEINYSSDAKDGIDFRFDFFRF